MTTAKAFIKRYPVATYFAMTLVISWGGVLILGAPHGMPVSGGQFEKLWPVVFLPYFLGPSIASLLLTGLAHGRAGLRDLLSRLLRWRVDARWYAIALLTAPLLVTPTLFALSLTSSAFLPAIITTASRVSLVLSGLVVGLVFGGLLEELGWTGFAVPGLRRTYGVFATGIILGVLHSVWHLLPTFWGSGDSSGVFSLRLFLPPCLFYVGVLPPYRVLMVWVYDRSGSLAVAMLMHASLTACTLFILSPSVRGAPLMVYYLALSALTWVAAALVVGKCARHKNRAKEE